MSRPIRCSPGSIAPGPFIAASAFDTAIGGLRLRHGRKGGAGVIAFDTPFRGLCFAVGVLAPSTHPPACVGVLVCFASLFATHTRGGDPGILYPSKIKVKDPESETSNTLD